MSQLRLYVDRAGIHAGTPWALIDERRQIVSEGLGIETLPFADELLAIIPDDCVTVINLRLPKLSAREIQAALPAAVEDHLVTALEDTDLVLLAHQSEGISRVAAWSRQWSVALQSRLALANASKVRVVAESWGLPVAADNAGLLVSRTRCVLRRPDGTTLVDEYDGKLTALMDRALDEQRQQGIPVSIFADSRATPGTAPGTDPDTDPGPDGTSTFDWRTAGYPAAPSLHTRNKRAATWSASVQALRIPALLAAAWLVFESIAVTVDWGLLRLERNRILAQQKQIFVEVVGTNEALTDGELQVRRKLDAARVSAGVSATNDFMTLMGRLATRYPGAAPLSEINYQEGQLELHAADASAGTAWLKAAQDAGLTATAESAADAAQGTRLRIRP